MPAFYYLTPEYRVRLRPTVNPEALERCLAAIEPAARTAAVLTFVHPLTATDLRVLSEELGDDEALREVDRLLEEPLPQEPLPPLSGKHHRPPGFLEFVTVPTRNYVVQLQPPKDPKHLALWRAIEPGFTDREWPGDGAVVRRLE